MLLSIISLLFQFPDRIYLDLLNPLQDTYSSIISIASSSLCTGTPTASFAAIFSSIAASVPPASSGATSLSDQFPSQSAVSLYYTASGSQGPGAITGSATAATKAASASNSVTTLTGTHSSSGSGSTSQGSASTPSGSAGTSSASAASSSSGAKPTNFVGLGGLAVAVGGLVAAGL